MYDVLNTDDETTLIVSPSGSFIPVDAKNKDFKLLVVELAENGESIFSGDVPQELLDAVEVYNQATEAAQLLAYKAAVERLAKPRLADGVPEQTITVCTGQEWNEETAQMEDVYVDVVKAGIDPAPATIDVPELDENGIPTGSDVNMPNPDIVEDDAERAAAQAVIDATPQSVKEAAE